MPLDAPFLDLLRAQVGVESTRYLGEITRQLVARYARAIGDDDPLFFDPEQARARGHHDVVAPPNLLSSVMCWDEGTPTHELRADGTEGRSLPAGLPASEFRILGGGEEIELLAPVTAGMRVVERVVLRSVLPAEAQGAHMVALTYEHLYSTADGQPLLRSTRTVIVR